MVNYIIGGAVIGAMIYTAFRLYKNRGRGGCGCGCSGCEKSRECGKK